MNEEQLQAFTAVISAELPVLTATEPFKPVNSSECLKERNKIFFPDAPGGTGKMILIKAIHKLLRSRERKVIAVSTSAVAASLLDRGRTAHSAFKIPIPYDSTSTCNITVESKLAQELRELDLIIWDEVVMCHRYCIEAVDRTVRDIMISEAPFWRRVCLIQRRFPSDSSRHTRRNAYSSCTCMLKIISTFPAHSDFAAAREHAFERASKEYTHR